MKIGITGLPQTGKKTLFQLLTGASGVMPAADQKKSVSGVAEIIDPRFDVLESMYAPKKSSRARINIELLPKIEATSIRDGDIFKDIADMDALCHVVRAFADDAIYHVSGSVNPERDIDSVNSELVLHDLLFVEKRLERLEQNKKKSREDQLKNEEELLLRFRAHLENDLPLRVCDISDEEKKIIGSYPFITIKQMIIALNVSDSAMDDTALLNTLSAKYLPQGITLMQICAKLESEIAQLDTAQEKRDFMEAAGIAEPAINLLSRLCMEALGLISFFTVGSDEVKQWLLRRGALAPEAGGVIHTDIQRGFIRAEVIKYDDLTEYGSEDAVKKAGRLHVMGKDYTVQDGDIVNFRFNV